MNETNKMGRFEERRRCAKRGCKRWDYTRFCHDHFQEPVTRKIDRQNILPRKNPAVMTTKKETGVNAPEGEQQ